MASARFKKLAAAALELPECPVCMETMSAPIFQCQSGHSLCSSCTRVLSPPNCPICRQPMTQIRNWQLEEIIAKAKVSCPNKNQGCVYTMVNCDVEEHLKECIFREMDCPLGAVFGKCSWKGHLKMMIEHFKERHPAHCNISSDSEVELDNIKITEDDRHMFLVAQGKLLFIITMKIDTLQKMVYWAVQHIGGKKSAQQHVYEIHVSSKQDTRRKTVFIEHCFNDAIKADEVFRIGKCAVMPLDVLSHFIKDRKLSFRFFIKRMPPVQKEKINKGDVKKDENKPPGPGKAPKGPKPAGSHNAGPKGFKKPAKA
ncbi:E3 ubiquitin-protein ligase Siah1-like [Plodia interpunctella]|uniref:E3 ubiquitin-protein ligase Siah1-like n=1 Tax=Plodia interpunctella TaxID=58824 RepID=UPI002368B2D8|nr:E3 ubiquitin-protein ligase Siah1-like [Plodia interpunctella]XP_053607939.1 E3 ubiquitin-protein ligase Siah1-like [Plodia interpunctella]XP_053607940.1 E3 ubiquitin-protein ligase Siah1-like [Plodia interpunctella]